MRQLDAFLVWLGIIVIGLLALIFSFYVASVLLPIFLAGLFSPHYLIWGQAGIGNTETYGALTFFLPNRGKSRRRTS